MSHATTLSEAVHEEAHHYHTFTNLAMFLAVLTGIELVLIFLPFADWLVLSALAVLSIIKFVGVVAWFMHLIYDKMLLTFLFLAGIGIATLTMIALLLLFEPGRVDDEALSGMTANALRALA